MGVCRLFVLAFVVLPLVSLFVWKGTYSVYYWETSHIDVAVTKGKTAVVTGASPGGIGFEVAVELALVGVNVEVISRSAAVGAATVAALQRAVQPGAPGRRTTLAPGAAAIAAGTFGFHVADLAASPVASVQAAVASIAAKCPSIDLLILNAGVFSLSPFRVSDDGRFESQIAVSYIAHYVLTAGLMPLLLAQAPQLTATAKKTPRVVATETLGTWFGTLENFTFLPDNASYTASNLTRVKVHCNTKLALQSFLEQLQGRYGGQGLKVVHSHPGMCASRLFREYPEVETDLLHQFAQSTRVGALSVLRAAVDATAIPGDFVAPNYAMLGYPVLGHLLPMRWPKTYSSDPVHAALFAQTQAATGVQWP